MRQLIVATGFGLLLTGCGLLKVNVNGKVQTLGGDPASEPSSQPSAGSAKSAGSESTSSQGAGSSSEKSEQQRERDAQEAVADARRAMLDHVAKVDKLINAQAGPVFESDVTELENQAKELGKLGDAEGKAFARYVAKSYRIENAWRVEAAQAAPTLKKALGAEVVTEGTLTGKKKPVSFSFSAEAGHCYYALSHLVKDGGEEDRLNSFRFDAGNDSPSLQRFRVDGRRTNGPGVLQKIGKSYLYGFCALKNTTVTATAEMQYAGTQNGLRYVVLETERDAFPEHVAVDLEVIQNDSCDAANWESLWVNPIPGSVLYGGDAPFLPYDVGHARELWMTAYSARGGDARLMRKSVSSKPPGNLKFGSDVNFRGCPKEKKYAHSPMANKVASCYEGLHKKYDAQYDAANRVIDNSRGILNRARARHRIDQLNAQWDAEENRSCKPLQAQARKEWDAAYNRIVDFYGDKPYVSPFDRAELMKQQYLGSYPPSR